MQDDKLHQWMHDLPLRDLPALETALDVPPEQADESELEEAITVAMATNRPCREANSRSDHASLDNVYVDLEITTYPTL